MASVQREFSKRNLNSDVSESLIITGENFDAILDAIDEEEDVQWIFEVESEEFQAGQFTCPVCEKQCKSKGGLTRHSSAKHKTGEEFSRAENAEMTEAISISSLTDVMVKAVTTASRNKCFPLNVTEEIKCFPVLLTEESSLYKDIQGIYKKLQKHGDAEEFYTAFFSSIVFNSTDYFAPLTCNASTFLASKIADGLLIHYKKSLTCDSLSNTEQMELSQEEKDGLGYLGGYVFHNLFRKIKKSKFYATKESQDCMQILKAGKTATNNAEDPQGSSLVTKLNRGGLWELKSSPRRIFEVIELNFRKNVAVCGQRKIDTTLILEKCIKDPEIVSHFKTVVEESETHCSNKTLIFDLLTSIVKLYVRVRSFSYAKDIIQRLKVKDKIVKSKALRKEIKRSSNDPQVQE